MFNLRFIKLSVPLFFLFLSASGSKANQQELPAQNQRIEDRLHFIGEVRGRSYIKLELIPIQTSSDFVSGENEVLRYKGTYYESVNGRKYTLTAVFNAEDRSWTFRCFNASNRQIYIFKGKQKADGDIDGTWRSKSHSYPFYLRSQ